jgi:hypothetical protein
MAAMSRADPRSDPPGGSESTPAKRRSRSEPSPPSLTRYACVEGSRSESPSSAACSAPVAASRAPVAALPERSTMNTWCDVSSVVRRTGMAIANTTRATTTARIAKCHLSNDAVRGQTRSAGTRRRNQSRSGAKKLTASSPSGTGTTPA